uniref:Fibronectin type-III domain-containing protein n=1 Tax=Heliothis virescens TaxID=7102 RepID=A0A2A4JIC7_HELVI
MDVMNKESSDMLKRKCREVIVQSSPSMMWKRSIVQARAGCARAVASLALLLAILASTWRSGACADLVIEIPGSGGGEADAADGGHYRLDYRPPDGSPAPNITVPARANTINFVGLPGTKYHFMLYYSNATFADLLTWNQTIITAPEPPTNLTVTLGRNKQATISWSPPAHGDYTGFRFKVIPLTERAEGGARNVSVEGAGNWSHTLRDLSPGATYQLHAFTLLHDKESAAYASRNFTTKPNTPGKFIVWFRNETTLLVLWQPPYPPGAYTHYKVSIVPPDARDSELYVEKEGEPPGPAQAAFKGLVPGRAYNISVQTVSEPEISAPTTAQYRTVPLRPRNVTVPLADLKETSFKVTWLPPLEESEFEKYQVSVSGLGASGGRRLAPVVRARNDTPACSFEGLEPGAPYTVTVKTMSGKVTSWPATSDLTLKPLSVRGLAWRLAAEGADVWWSPAPGSTQDEYKVSYHEAGPSRDDSSTLTTAEARVQLRALLPGRNYSVLVSAVSRGVPSAPRAAALATRPLAPVLLPGRRAAPACAWRAPTSPRARTPTSCATPPRPPGLPHRGDHGDERHGWRSCSRAPCTRSRWRRELRAAERAPSHAEASAVTVEGGPARAASALGGFVLRLPHARRPALARARPAAATAVPQRFIVIEYCRSLWCMCVAQISNMTHGEHYIIQLDTLSEGRRRPTASRATTRCTRSTRVRTANPVSNVEQLVDTRNMTLEWPVPGGRVECTALAGGPRGGGAAGARNLSAPPARGPSAPRWPAWSRPRLHA